MHKPSERSKEDEVLISRIFDILKTNLHADPYGWDGALAREIQSLPVGLRAMAATHHLDVSLTLDDMGWHFLNFGHPSHVEETEHGLRELGLENIAVLFREAYELVHPHLDEIRRGDCDFYAVMEREGHEKRIRDLSWKALQLLDGGGIYQHWAVYAREHPNRVFDSKP
jgi:hypothetical protein